MARLKIAKLAAADISIRFLLLDQIKALQAMGHEVVVFCAPGKWVEEIRAEGINLETLDIAREPSPWRDLRSLIALWRIFRRHKFDVVHTDTPKAGLLGPIAAKLAGVPVIVHTIHGLLFHDRMSRWRKAFFWLPEKITATFSDYLLSQSREDMNVAVSSGLCSSKKLTYLGNGINVSKFSPADYASSRKRLREQLGFTDEHFVIGSVGRLVYEKGFAELFHAAEQLAAKRTDLRFIIIGPEEPDQSDAVSLDTISTLVRRGIVHFLGFQSDMAMYYSLMDLFVLPSHREGIPRACMEAAAMERAVIATNIRGCREVVKHGETGLLVPVRNAGALAHAIETLAANKERCVEMGRQGRLHILREFDQQQVFERLRAFYGDLEQRLSRPAEGSKG